MHTTLAAAALTTLAAIFPLGHSFAQSLDKNDGDIKPDAAKMESAKPAAPSEAGRIGEALKALVEAKDEEAVKLMEGAQANEGKMQMTAADAEKLVARAKKQGLIPAKAPESGIKADAENAARVLKPLAEKGDQKAKDLLQKASGNGGRLEMTQEDVADLIKRAKDQGVLPKADSALIGKAIQALAAKGDADASSALEKAKANGGRLEITAEQGEKFYEKAKADGLVP